MQHATEAQLVVVGTRGRNALSSAILGSTGLIMLHHSRVPVMICPALDAGFAGKS
jgi:nucleotide-binding universal stress UspA family protein